MNSDKALKDEAVQWVREHADEIIERLASNKRFKSEPNALSVFMAGSPGAGKTETSKALLRELEDSDVVKGVVRIDPDQIRGMLPQYTGGNAHLFQKAVSIGVDKVFNHALKTGKNMLLDGTFSNYDRARENVSKSLKRNRHVYIVYVYTDPFRAWEFTRAREKKEGRNIPKDAFIKELFNAKETVGKIMREFPNIINLTVLEHDYTAGTLSAHHDVDAIDRHIKIPYTQEDLNKKL